MHQDHRLSVAEIYNNSNPRDGGWWLPWLALNETFCLAMVPNGGILTDVYNFFNGRGLLPKTYVYGFDESTRTSSRNCGTLNAITSVRASRP